MRISTLPASVGTGTERPERRLPRRNRQRQSHVAPFELKQPMRTDVHLQVQISRAAAARRGLALAREPDLLAFRDARRNRHAHRVSTQLECAVRLQLRTLQIERARAAAIGLLEIEVDAARDDRALRGCAATRTRRAGKGRTRPRTARRRSR